jgi:hypothetical protein
MLQKLRLIFHCHVLREHTLHELSGYDDNNDDNDDNDDNDYITSCLLRLHSDR